jgi:hypothetical protein
LFFKVILLWQLLALSDSVEYGKVRASARHSCGEATRLPTDEPAFVQDEVDLRRLNDRNSTLASKYRHRIQKSCLARVRNQDEFWILSPVGAGLRGTRNAG